MLALLLATGSAQAQDHRLADDPVAKRERILEHRAEEAASKAALVKGLMAAEAARTVNQTWYDVHHYELDLDLNPTTETLSGTVTVTAEVTGTSISTLDLNLASDMAVSFATSGGAPSTFSRSGDILTVNLDRTYTTAETVVVGVTYSGDPSGGSFGWDNYPSNGPDMIWTLSEPYGAREWWPCKDLNSDKADSVDIIVTVPENLTVASNGLLVSNLPDGSTRTFHWKSNYPITTYLVSLAIHPYVQYSDWYSPQGGGDPMEVQFYIFPDHVGQVETNYALTVPMLGVFAQAYGEYPFVAEKYGHADFTWGGGMEHQTMTSMGGWSEDLISHELAHQWWGDMVTCDDFGHIWLNEGFATWSEAYWAEQTYGFAEYQQYMDYAAYYGEGTIFVENPGDFWTIFDSNLSYNKASWVVHMLRGVVGDEDFFAGLALYRSNHEYGSATTEQLQAAMETVSGKDLTAFFQQWIYGEYYPIYSYTWVPGPGPDEITVTISQEQTFAGVFTMPIVLRVETDTGTVDLMVENSQLVEDFVLTVPGTVDGIQLDPDHWILRQVRTTVTNPSFDQGILLVNGVDWATYDPEIHDAYSDSTFWGDNPITFWDCFGEPHNGYPASLPEPIGHGAVPASVIGDHSTVIWVGNNYNGDLGKWAETPIQSYLEVGGNVLLMTRRSQSFLEGNLTNYLGVTWAEEGTLGNCVAVAPGLVNIPFIGSQSFNDVYLTGVGSESTLLFTDTAGFSGVRGTGVWASPVGGGTHRETGGQFVHLAGRPYRMNHDALRQNVEYILENYLGEPYSPLSPVPGGEAVPGATAVLGQNFPNPFNPSTTINFSLAAAGPVQLRVYDLSGRLVRTLVDEGKLAAGDHEAVWDGQDERGRAVSAGVYFYNLETEGYSQTRRMTMVK
jgi:hypothetical protein